MLTVSERERAYKLPPDPVLKIAHRNSLKVSPKPNMLEASPAEGGDELQYTTGPEERIGAGAGTIDRELVIGYCGGAAAVPYCTVPARRQGIAGELGPSRRG